MSISYLMTIKTITRICWIIINFTYLATALKDVRVIVPRIVRRGDNATLNCYYDLQNDTLYSVKWYRGRREFYRYTPRQNPPMKVFPHNGITVERSKSNESHLFLTSVGPSVSGKYSCEVSADAPSFDTEIMSGDLEVVEIPENGPRIEGTNNVYSVGDILLANCTQSESRPAANLTWLINNLPARSHQIVMYSNMKNMLNDTETSVLGVKLVVTPKHFRSSHLKLACLAKIYNIYERIVEKTIDLDASTNLILFDDPFSTLENSYDNNNNNKKQLQYANNADESNKDIKMHHMQAEDISSSSPPSLPLRLSYMLRSNIFQNNQRRQISRDENYLQHFGEISLTMAVAAAVICHITAEYMVPSRIVA